eukprot:4591-Heterococcus_DN1.PRE.1
MHQQQQQQWKQCLHVYHLSYSSCAIAMACSTTTTLQVAERQRELQHARDLVDMEQARYCC